ncbi:MAG: WYL domain-containing protein [Ruminococcus sp.]|jgi:predicted DNA-binding transcriptional regulator YafY|nr:WYL domain-containing protein [Ruminococcus sp.]
MIDRTLTLHTMLEHGEVLHKAKICEKYGISEKSFQRDIAFLRSYVGSGRDIVYDRQAKVYRLVGKKDSLTAQEILGILKILVESRSLCAEEFGSIYEKLLAILPKESKDLVRDTVINECGNYLPVSHNKPLLDTLWKLAELKQKQVIIEIDYTRQDGTAKTHRVKPIGLLFSEFYFYLIGYVEGKTDFSVFRLDKISRVKGTKERFDVEYADRFQEAEFRKRIQWMYTGKLEKVRFYYTGADVTAILDRLPTAVIEEEADGKYLISAEVYTGLGFDMWVRSQGEKIKIL